RGRAAACRLYLHDQSRPHQSRRSARRVHGAAHQGAHPAMLARLSESIGTFFDLRRVLATAVVATAMLLLVPFFAGPYLLHLLTISLYYVILAASWNMLAGLTGQFSLAHQAFAAVGAYTSGLLVRYYHLPLWFTIPCGVGIAAILGYGLGRMA